MSLTDINREILKEQKEAIEARENKEVEIRKAKMRFLRGLFARSKPE